MPISPAAARPESASRPVPSRPVVPAARPDVPPGPGPAARPDAVPRPVPAARPDRADAPRPTPCSRSPGPVGRGPAPRARERRGAGPGRPWSAGGAGRRPSSNPYLRLLATPGARAFTAGNLIARLPMGMFSVSAVIMIAGSRGSYALAGAVTATGLAATAVVAPFTARLVDRFGQARVAVPATALAVLGSLALVLCVHYDAPAWTLFAAYAATATTPNTGGMSRARWAHLHRGDPAALHTANSFEQAADELCFMLGPVLAATLCGALFPEAGTLVGAVLLMSGVLVFAAQRATEPPVTPRTRTVASPLRTPGMPALLAVFLATGAVFGAMEVVSIAHAGGAILALQAAGSCAAGLVYGSLRPARNVRRRLLLCLAAMTALMSLPLLAAAGSASLPVLAACLLVAGAATAPTMVTGMTLVQRSTRPEQLNEGMTLAVTALLGGIAAGAATGGWLVEHAGTATGYAAPMAAAALALVIAGAGTRTGSRKETVPRTGTAGSRASRAG
ncbi:MFS transporter [Streptomyces sp. CB00271]|uniref:MFS transporter n=1 Tax=Streptomyces sp. CB00271 TaxID=2750025 RepID=UPI00165F29B0|nr:MFS transporter [Streptomyces sp. CB00271]QNQ36186.1 MFS transporter [Streptomyces sp. CB00271]